MVQIGWMFASELNQKASLVETPSRGYWSIPQLASVVGVTRQTVNTHYQQGKLEGHQWAPRSWVKVLPSQAEPYLNRYGLTQGNGYESKTRGGAAFSGI